MEVLEQKRHTGERPPQVSAQPLLGALVQAGADRVDLGVEPVGTRLGGPQKFGGLHFSGSHQFSQAEPVALRVLSLIHLANLP